MNKITKKKLFTKIILTIICILFLSHSNFVYAAASGGDNTDSLCNSAKKVLCCATGEWGHGTKPEVV